jgi:uncharacterized membrane protein
MLRIEYAYWLIAAFLIYTGLRNLRDGHGWHAAFWLVLGCVVALFAASRVARTPVHEGVAEGRRLLDAIGWAALLPLLLAALGQVFTQSGVGTAIAAIATDFLPTGNATAALLVFALGMVLFTVIMGNAFAAFPVIMAGIGLPLLIRQYGANPAILGSMGMLCGYCGTLVTPMAADFNLVPAALLELRNPYGVIRAQAWSALWIFISTVRCSASHKSRSHRAHSVERKSGAGSK